MNVTAANAESYQWTRNNRPIPGATSTSYTIRDAQRYVNDGAYTVIVSSGTSASRISIRKSIFVIVEIPATSVQRVQTLGDFPVELGFYKTSTQLTQEAPSGLSNVIDLSMPSEDYIYAVKKDGTLVGWGASTTQFFEYFPRSLKGVVAVATGNNATVLLEDGSVESWGNPYGAKVALPSGLTGVISIAASGVLTLALKNDGEVIAWRSDNQAHRIPPGLTDVVSIAVGSYHCLAARADGTVVAWTKFDSLGTFDHGQTKIPVGLGGVVTVAAGEFHSVAMTSDGKVVDWGSYDPSYPSPRIKAKPDSLSDVISILSAGRFVTALRRNGSLVNWGSLSNEHERLDSLDSYIVGAICKNRIFRATIFYDAKADTVPRISRGPISMTKNLDDAVMFEVAVEPSFLPTSYQWRKSGINIIGATNYSYRISKASLGDSGMYDVVVSNYLGNTTSAGASLIVTPASPAVISAQPSNITTRIGQAATLSVTTTGSPTPSFQWFKDGVAIVGATNSSYTISSVNPPDGGSYLVTAKNIFNGVSYNLTSAPVTLTVLASRLINLSILTPLAPGEVMTLGTVLGGSGTSGTKALLVRGVGPSLQPFGVSGFMPDPTMTVYRGQSVLATNDNWGGSSTLANAFNVVGAFSYASTGSRDSAYYNTSMAAGAHTIALRGVGTSSGTVLAEIYDATPASSLVAATPRLVNLSVLKDIRPGDTLTAGFVVGGNAPKSLLVRAIGPSLGTAPFNIGGVMTDPRLSVYSGQNVIASNDNWGAQTNSSSAASLTSAFDTVGAFRISDTASKDAILLVTLDPGNYTAVVSSSNGGGGITITEVYELP